MVVFEGGCLCDFLDVVVATVYLGEDEVVFVSDLLELVSGHWFNGGSGGCEDERCRWGRPISLLRTLVLNGSFFEDALCFECGAEPVFTPVEAEVFEVFAVAVIQFGALRFPILVLR